MLLKLIIFIIVSCFVYPTHTQNQATEAQIKTTVVSPEELIPFSFNAKPLTELINSLAAKKNVNIILPQQPTDTTELAKQTITYSPHDPRAVTLDEAWRLLQTFLELSGFSLIKREDDLYVITRVGKRDETGITQEPLPLYVETPATKIPKSSQYIRYIYYLRNLQIPEDQRNNAIAQMLSQMKTPGTPEPIFLPKANGFILVDKADVIASIMYIIAELDSSGFKEAIEVIPLNFIPATEVANIFKQLKLAAGKEKTSPFIKAENKPENITYFAADTTIISDDRNNSLVLMGRVSAINRISDFVKNYLDIPPESGESILHTYDLQYLDAQAFAGILQDIIKPIVSGPQATQTNLFGAERFFQGAYVVPEKSEQVVNTTPTTEGADFSVQVENFEEQGPVRVGIQGTAYTGGNRLLVAALQDDWQKIKKLIEILDHPEPQVIIEVLIVDFTNTERKIVASEFRTATDPVKVNEAAQLLASHIVPPINALPTQSLGSTPANLAADLLGVVGVDNNVPGLTNFVQPGSILFSFNDPATPGIMGVLQILQSISNTKIVSHPFLVTTNNQKGITTSQIVKRAPGPAIPGEAGVTKIDIINLPATIQVEVIPRLSSLDRMSLQIAVDVNEFLLPGVENFTRITRRVETNANIGSDEILVIGGLTRVNETDNIRATPFLSDLPIIGYLFKRVEKIVSRTNYAIFISPTVVEPRLRSGLNLYTSDKIRKTRRDVSDATIYDDYDPITQWFFNPRSEHDNLLKEYVVDSTNAPTVKNAQAARRRQTQKTPIHKINNIPKQSAKTHAEEITELKL